jgi:predicted Zn-dependent protease
VTLIRRPEKNAFVIPGGKVFVYSGILPICRSDDGLAAVLGHEIAHNLARHAAERMSSTIMITPILWGIYAVDFTGIIGQILGRIALDIGFMRPASRKQESEADYIGLMMMAQACYDPHAAVGLWQRMEVSQEQDTPEWISTHPSNANRILRIQEWLPKALEKREESECGSTTTYALDFNKALQRGFWLA